MPVWVLGLAAAPFGLFGGIWTVTVPQLLAAQHVPEPTIASVSSLSGLPTSIGFLIAPALDLWISRKAWTLLTAAAVALSLFAALLCRQSVVALGGFMFLGWLSAVSFAAASFAWLGPLLPDERRPAFAAWSTVANIGAGGLMVVVAMPILRHLPLSLGAALLGLATLAPVAPLLWLEAPPPSERLSHEAFGALLGDVWMLVRRPVVARLLLLFAMPAASFALTNVLGGLGGRFGASEQFVSTVGGIGVMVAGIVGSLGTPWLLRRVDPVRLYLSIGVLGAGLSGVLAALAPTPLAFAAAMLGENIFQSAAFTASNSISLRSLGRDNPLGATQMALLLAASNVPLTIMQIVDGHAFGQAGVARGLLTDAGISFAACALLATLYWRRGAKRLLPAPEPA